MRDVLCKWNWRQFNLKRVDPERDVDEIIKFLKGTFYIDAPPLSKCTGIGDAKSADLDLLVRKTVSHNLSLIAIDKDTQQIAGVRVNSDGRQKLDVSKLPIKSPHIAKITKWKNLLLTRGMENPDWAKYDTGDDFSSTPFAAVHPLYRGEGLATELANQSLELLRMKKFPIIRSYVASPIARKIAYHFGYKEISRVYYEELVGYDGEGIPDFEKAEPGTYGSLMVLKL